MLMKDSFPNEETGAAAIFPELPYEKWKDTYTTLHMWLQIAGKIKLALMPMMNHWWQVSLFVSPAGITTGPIPYDKYIFDITFDIINQKLIIQVNNGKKISLKLYPRSVSEFYNELMSSLYSLGIDVKIWTTPVEVDVRIPFEQDNIHASYDFDYVHRFWSVLVQVDKLMKEFKARFSGKTSPVSFYWGSFDMSLSVYSGKPAPLYTGIVQNVSSKVMKESMSKEEYTCGFWPGAGFGEPAFYAYAYPEPPGFRDIMMKPEGTYFNKDIGEYILPYETVRNADGTAKTIQEFFRNAYEAAANTGKWDKESIEYKPVFLKK